MEGILEGLAEKIEKTNISDLPEDVVKEVKRHLLDVIGVMLAGYKTEVGEKVVTFVRGLKYPEESSIVGWGGKSSSSYGALANTAMGFHLELDDVHRTSHTHPGITTIPAALAIGERMGSGGRELIAAINAGYETEIRIGQALSPSIFLDRVFLPCSLLGSFGAAATTCKLLKLEKEKIVGALGNVATLTPLSIFESYKSGTITKEFMMGWTNAVGIMGASMAEHGMGGPRTAIEGSLGFANAAADRYDLGKIESANVFYQGIRNTCIKPYACCRQHHTAVDAALELRNRYHLKAEEIEEVVDRTFSVASRGDDIAPKTVAAAKYSAPYIIAVALTEGKVWREQFSEEKIRDPKLLTLARKVKVLFDPELEKLYDEKWPSLVEVKAKDGKVYSARYDLPKGEPEVPITDSELEEKFISLATDTISKKAARGIIDIVWNLEHLKDVKELMPLLKA